MHESTPNPLAEALLDASGNTYASFAATLLLERRPELLERFGEDAFRSWRGQLKLKLDELGSALGVGEPRLFLARVEWARRAFLARGVPEADLDAALSCLAETLAEKLPPNLRPLAVGLLDEARAALGLPLPSETPDLDPRDPSGRLALEYLELIFKGDTRGAGAKILAACERGRQPAELYLEVLLPAQREIGRLWHAGEINVADEHLATATTRRVMSLLCQRAVPARFVGRTVITAAVAGDNHDLGVRAAADFFEMAGWRVVCLGADVPAFDVAEAVRSFEADLLALSATLDTQLKRFRETVLAVRAVGRSIAILAGGLVFAAAPELAKKLGADAYAPCIGELPREGARLVGALPPQPP